MAIYNISNDEYEEIKERYEFNDILDILTGFEKWKIVCDEFVTRCDKCPIEPLCKYVMKMLRSYEPYNLDLDRYDATKGCFDWQIKSIDYSLREYDYDKKF